MRPELLSKFRYVHRTFLVAHQFQADQYVMEHEQRHERPYTLAEATAAARILRSALDADLLALQTEFDAG